MRRARRGSRHLGGGRRDHVGAGAVGGRRARRLQWRGRWRAIFFLNVPLAAVTIALAISSVPNSHKPDAPQQLDWPIVVMAAAGLAAFTRDLTQAVGARPPAILGPHPPSTSAAAGPRSPHS